MRRLAPSLGGDWRGVGIGDGAAKGIAIPLVTTVLCMGGASGFVGLIFFFSLVFASVSCVVCPPPIAVAVAL